MDFASAFYTGDGTTPRSFTGLGFAPKVVAVSRYDSANAHIWKTPDMNGTDSFVWVESTYSTSAQGIRSLDSDGFTIGSDDFVNFNTGTFFYWALSEDANALATGTYAGDGTDDRNITVGFQPDIVLVQATPQTGLNTRHCYLWVGTQGGDSSANIEGNLAATVNFIQGIGTTFFQVGTSANQAAQTYFWLALKRTTNNIIEGTYVGDGTDNRNIVFVGDSFTPELVFVKGAIGGTFNLGSVRTNAFTGDDASVFGQGAPFPNVIQTFNSGGFQVGSSLAINQSGPTYWYFAFKSGPVVAAAPTVTPGDTGFGGFAVPNDPYTIFKTMLDVHKRYKNVRIQ